MFLAYGQWGVNSKWGRLGTNKIGIFTVPVISSLCTAAPSLLQNWKNRVVQLKRSSLALLEQTEKATIPHPLLSLKQLKLPDFHVDAAFEGAKKIS